MAAAAPNITCSHPTAEKPDGITSLFVSVFNFPKKNFPEASQQTSHVSLVRIVSYLSHSVSGICEWRGRAFLVWYLVRLPSSEGQIGVEGSDS